MDPVTHFEIPVDDMERAQTFYNEAFGWTSLAPEGMEGEYEMAMTSDTAGDMRPSERGRIDGAFYRRERSDEGTMVTIGVDSIDDAVKRVVAAGGEIVIEPHKVRDLGFYARFRDSEGNIVSLWESAEE